MKQNVDHRWLDPTVSISVFTFYALALSVPSGYLPGPILLFLTSLLFLARGSAPQLSREDKTIIALLLITFAMSVLALFLHHNPLETLDQTRLYLAAVPILLLLLRAPPRLGYVWVGLIVGTLSAAGVATWQRHWLGMNRPYGFVLNPIPFGDMALLMGVLCAAGVFWAGTQGRHAGRWRAALLIGALAGLYGSLLSVTRGSWITLPPIVALFCAAFANKQNMKQAVAVCLALIAALTIAFAVPQSGVQARYDKAISGTQNYLDANYSGSNEGSRLEAWRLALNHIAQKPWLGWGRDEYRAEVHQMFARGETSRAVARLHNTHNIVLEAWLFQGLPGLLTLLAFYAVPFWFFAKRLRATDTTVKVLAVGGLSLLISFFMFNMTEIIVARYDGAIFLVLTLSVLWASLRRAERPARSNAGLKPTNPQTTNRPQTQSTVDKP